MTLSTAFSMDDMCWRIYCESHGRVAIAGPRILRGGPHPDVAWSHETQEQAEADAKKLRAYFEGMPAARKTKVKSKDRSAYD
jgi:hypothetical protein